MPEPCTIAVLGAGYAGLFAARRAAHALRHRQRGATRIVLIDREHSWVERTRWHQLAAGERVAERRLNHLFRGTGVEVMTADVGSIDLENRAVTFASLHPSLSFDRLVYALGSRSSAHQMPGALDHGHTLDTPYSSRRVAAVLARHPVGHLSVIGGGLTGIQTATQIAARYPATKVTLFSSGRVAHELTSPARDYVTRALEARGVDLVVARVTSVEEHGPVIEDRQVPTDLGVWTAGFTPSEVGAAAGLAITDQGQIVVDAAMRSTSHPFVFAAGDSAATTRAGSPYGAYAATATGAVAGRNAVLDIIGREAERLDLGYAFLGVSLGGTDAVLQGLRPDGSPRDWLVTGRVAHALKEGVEHYVSGALRGERRMPGLYRWSPSSH